jgi:hypothetical protein
MADGTDYRGHWYRRAVSTNWLNISVGMRQSGWVESVLGALTSLK